MKYQRDQLIILPSSNFHGVRRVELTVLLQTEGYGRSDVVGVPALSPVDFWTGIVCDVYPVPIVPGDPAIFISVSRIADFTAIGLPETATNVGSGAGLTAEAAYYAAVGESIERYAVAVPSLDTAVLASSKEMRSLDKHHTAPSEWTLYEPGFLSRQTTLEEFTEETCVAWIPSESLTACESNWVPACMVQMPYVPQLGSRSETIVDFATSTGLACAQTRRQALVGAICEIVERDAFVIMWRNRIAAPRVFIDNDTEFGKTFTAVFNRPGLEYNLFYTTLDLEIPSFFGYVRDYRCSPPAVVAGGAAHPNPEIAALKTLTELAQGLAWVHNPGRMKSPLIEDFDLVKTFDDHMRLYADNPPMEAFSFLQGSESIALHDIPPLSGSDLLHSMTDIFRKRDLDLTAVDLTTPDVDQCGLKVVKVLAPQCEVLDAIHLLPHLSGKRWRQFSRDGGNINVYPHPYP